MSTERRQFCTFYLDDLYFGIDVLKVQEIIRYHEMTRVPLAPTMVKGLINLRGDIVTAMDLRHCLGLAESSENERRPMNVVVRTEDGTVSFLVDEIGDVLEVRETSYERPPDNIDKNIQELVEGVYKLDGRLLLALDIDKAIHAVA